jgi:hypothetical protein
MVAIWIWCIAKTMALDEACRSDGLERDAAAPELGRDQRGERALRPQGINRLDRKAGTPIDVVRVRRRHIVRDSADRTKERLVDLDGDAHAAGRS